MLPKEEKRSTEDWGLLSGNGLGRLPRRPGWECISGSRFHQARCRLSAPSCACLRRTSAMRCCA